MFSATSQPKSVLAIYAPAAAIIPAALNGLSALSHTYLAVPITVPILAPFCQLVNSCPLPLPPLDICKIKLILPPINAVGLVVASAILLAHLTTGLSLNAPLVKWKYATPKLIASDANDLLDCSLNIGLINALTGLSHVLKLEP